jgi:AraC-like DNA-binding protein
MLDIEFTNYPFHWHKYLEILYAAKGKLDVSVNGEIYSVKEGDIVLVNSDLIHGYFNVDQGTKIILFLFGTELFDQLLVDIRDSRNESLIFNRKILITQANDKKVYKKMVKFIFNLRNEYSSRKEGYRLAIKKILYDIALLLLREISPKKKSMKTSIIVNPNFSALERVFSYIHDHYDNPGINLETISDVAYLSKFYFSRFFRERTGMTFNTYLSRLRVNRVQKLLCETDMTITEIAYNCGFMSLKTFNRVFKLYTGVSPLSFRGGESVHASKKKPT